MDFFASNADANDLNVVNVLLQRLLEGLRKITKTRRCPGPTFEPAHLEHEAGLLAI
jgi:hypothetical protein